MPPPDEAVAAAVPQFPRLVRDAGEAPQAVLQRAADLEAPAIAEDGKALVQRTTAKRRGGARAGAGRKPHDIDGKQVEQLAWLGLTMNEIAGAFGVHDDTIRQRFELDYRAGKAKRAMDIRAAQLVKALNGDTTMLVWLGKNELGQTDKMDVNHGGIVQHEHRALIAQMMTSEKVNAALDRAARAALRLPALPPPPDDQDQVESKRGKARKP